MKKEIEDKKFIIASFIVTYFNIGNVKYAPGTFGSLATFPLFFILNYLFLNIGIQSISQLFIAYLSTLFILIILSLWSINVYITTNNKKDPSEVIIDEVVGQLIAFIFPTLLTLYYFIYMDGASYINSTSSIVISFIIIIVPIIFFRLFDILKPGLIGYFDEQVDGATGILMDDIIAGIYSALISSLILSIFFSYNIFITIK